VPTPVPALTRKFLLVPMVCGLRRFSVGAWLVLISPRDWRHRSGDDPWTAGAGWRTRGAARPVRNRPAHSQSVDHGMGGERKGRILAKGGKTDEQ
jgi:hypothetical protein